MQKTRFIVNSKIVYMFKYLFMPLVAISFSILLRNLCVLIYEKKQDELFLVQFYIKILNTIVWRHIFCLTQSLSCNCYLRMNFDECNETIIFIYGINYFYFLPCSLSVRCIYIISFHKKI